MGLTKLTSDLIVDLEQIEEIRVLGDNAKGIYERTIELRFKGTGRIAYIYQDTPEFSALLEFINKMP